MLDDLLGIVEALIGRSRGTQADSLTGRTAADRLTSLYSLFVHLERELPQIIAEALSEAAATLSADAALLMEVQNNSSLFIAYSSDPSLLELTVPWVRALPNSGNGSGDVKLSGRSLEALDLRDALTTRLTTGTREWLLVFGSRGSVLDRKIFEEYKQRLNDLFTALLAKRDLATGQEGNTDHLTGLPDRWATMRRISEAILASQRNNTRAAVLFIDLNDFKRVNDTLGHGHGDKVLRSIATRMRAALRGHEFVGRIGGDEFAVVLSPIQSAEEAEHVAQRLYSGAQENNEEFETPVSLGIGIAFFPDHATNQEQWLHNADIAMYRAKRLRLPYCMFDESWSNEQQHHTATTAASRAHGGERAYEQQFLLCFQPIFDVNSGKVTAAEALVRLLHPRDGVLSAASAIHAAGPQEKLGLDMWVTRKALAYAEDWRAHGVSRVHVNLGDYDEATYQALMQTLTSSGIDPQMLAVELAKADDEDPEKFARFADAIAGAGAIVGIDDFAAGPLDLTYLEQTHIAFVKLSRLLLPSAGVTGKALEAIVAVSNVMNWDVIATRVATSDDRRLIRNAGVKFMQGFAFAQPMTAIDFQSWVEAQPSLAG